jgi:hemerythrin-like domain-containing protein
MNRNLIETARLEKARLETARADSPARRLPRRTLLLAAAAVPGALLPASLLSSVALADEKEKEVGAVEDLMREHGVLRRALLVYRESAARLRSEPGSIAAQALRDTALLFRSFGEDYHEQKLEEAHIFPALRKTGGAAAVQLDVLIAQHQRGREITAYILAVAGKGKIGAGDAEPLARAFDAMDRMYEHHAAHEDTVVFPAWKDALTAQQLDEMGDKFEEIEQQQFGKDGFEDAVRRIARIEQTLGMADLGRFTAPPPPRA